MVVVISQSVQSLRALSWEERLEISQTLNNLPLTQLLELEFVLGVPASVLPPPHEKKGIRIPALLEWVFGPSGIGGDIFFKALEKTIGIRIKTSSSGNDKEGMALENGDQPGSQIENEKYSSVSSPKVPMLKDKKRLSFTIEGTISEADRSFLVEVLKQLSEKSNTSSLSISEIREGSIKLVLEGEPEELDRIHHLVNSGELKSIGDKSIISAGLFYDLSGANLAGVDLSGANLSDSNLSRTDLSYANLQSGNFRNVNFNNANLAFADLSGADLRGANFTNATLIETNFDEANIEDVQGYTVQSVEGVVLLAQREPSDAGDFIYRETRMRQVGSVAKEVVQASDPGEGITATASAAGSQRIRSLGQQPLQRPKVISREELELLKEKNVQITSPLSVEININNRSQEPFSDEVVFTSGSGDQKRVIAVLDGNGNLRISGKLLTEQALTPDSISP